MLCNKSIIDNKKTYFVYLQKNTFLQSEDEYLSTVLNNFCPPIL